MLAEKKDYEGRLSHIRDLLATQKIDASDYNVMKSNFSDVINKLEAKLSGVDIEKEDMEELLQNGVENLLRLHECYENGDWAESRALIGSIYPENFLIEKNEFRTARVNEVVPVI